MKKFFCLLIAVGMIMSCFVACSSGTTENENLVPIEDASTSSTFSTENCPELTENEEKEEISDFPEAPEFSNVLSEYQKEINLRHEKGEKFITDDEESFYYEEGFYIRNGENGYILSYDEVWNEVNSFYYPVVWEVNKEPVIFYVTETGYVVDDQSNFYGNIHVANEEALIYSSDLSAVTYVKESGIIERWQFGNCIGRYNVPEYSEYCGLSYWEGYLFRKDGDVYAFDIYAKENPVKVIAHNVSIVIDCSYDATSDAWSQPLFLMTNGTVKYYCAVAEEPADSPNNLFDIYSEGGYTKGE